MKPTIESYRIGAANDIDETIHFGPSVAVRRTTRSVSRTQDGDYDRHRIAKGDNYRVVRDDVSFIGITPEKLATALESALGNSFPNLATRMHVIDGDYGRLWEAARWACGGSSGWGKKKPAIDVQIS